MRALHAFASTSESLTQETDSDFHYRCSLFPTRGKHQTGHAHTDSQSDSWVVEHRSDCWDTTSLQYAPVFPALHAIFAVGIKDITFAKVMSLIPTAFLGFRASHELREDGFGSRLQITTLQ